MSSEKKEETPPPLLLMGTGGGQNWPDMQNSSLLMPVPQGPVSAGLLCLLHVIPKNFDEYETFNLIFNLYFALKCSSLCCRS